MAIPPIDDLPLRTFTPAAWVAQVMRRPLALLDDHAHLERKAGSNAMALLCRWPDRLEVALAGAGRGPQERWTHTLTSVAKDEVEHLAIVLRLLHQRGGRLSKHHRNGYAAGLRKLVRTGGGPAELVDRLLISALIELRSCERFAILGDHCEDTELAKLYRGLWASEHGHYTAFVGLAELVASADAVDARWQRMLDDEAAVLDAQPPGARLHAGVTGGMLRNPAVGRAAGAR